MDFMKDSVLNLFKKNYEEADKSKSDEEVILLDLE